MKILALETSHQPGQVALLCESELVYHQDLPVEQRTTQSFAVELAAALAAANWQPSDIDLFAVCEGPGSFTGLRIGVTAAKTFGYATGASVAGVNTLDLLAFQALSLMAENGASSHMSATFWAVVDAQRKQLFVAQYALGQDDDHGWPLRKTDVQIVDARNWLQQLPPDELVTGSGLRRCRTLGYLPATVRCTAETCWTANAASLARLAKLSATRGETSSVWELSARYFRKSAAEEKVG